MNSKKDSHNIIDLKRFKVILGAYGANPEKWPVEEKNDAIRFLKMSPEAEIFVDLQHELDQRLNETYVEEINVEKLSLSILNTLPNPNRIQKSFFENVLDWLFPEETTALWKPALAAVLPLVIGITYGAQLSLSNEEDKWDQEFYLSSLIDYNISTELYLDNTETSKSEEKND